VEEVLPVESVTEYFRHFSVLELDFTFYAPLIDGNGEPTRSHHVLRSYAGHVTGADRLILKVPQVVFARKLYRGGAFAENPLFLDPGTFMARFYEPAIRLLGDRIGGFIFEQEYQRKKDRPPVEELAAHVDAFFSEVPNEGRYHMELRTDAFLKAPLFRVLEKHGIGQVLSHWTWLPPLSRQFSLAGRQTFNLKSDTIIRLMTPRGIRYEDAYARAHPFSNLVDGMMNPSMVAETAALMNELAERGGKVHVMANNRAGGNAPLIARQIVMRFLHG
jgi:uncharacterized protein YecE (DUF72 family)